MRHEPSSQISERHDKRRYRRLLISALLGLSFASVIISVLYIGYCRHGTAQCRAALLAYAESFSRYPGSREPADSAEELFLASLPNSLSDCISVASPDDRPSSCRAILYLNPHYVGTEGSWFLVMLTDDPERSYVVGNGRQRRNFFQDHQ